VQVHKNFAHCVYLALFHFREGRTNEALQAVRLTAQQPFVEPEGTDGNKFYLGQNAALIAYLSGNYELCLAMCDKMLSTTKSEKWWKRKILRIKAVARLMQADPGEALNLMREAELSAERDSFSADSTAKADTALRAAIETKDMVFIKQFENCVDEMDTWFSPFETDETGVHGADLNIPTPYPKSWTSNKMRRSNE
jgi:hypothetical protein